MAGQSAKSHAHTPTNTGILWAMALTALVLVVRHFDWHSRDWALLIVTLALIQVGWISRSYIVKLQDRIILLEMKVRAAELLQPGHEALMARLTKQQIIALRFASDDELAELLERAARENLTPNDIKAAIKTWRPDLLRT
jgi:hypothetical protein